MSIRPVESTCVQSPAVVAGGVTALGVPYEVAMAGSNSFSVLVTVNGNRFSRILESATLEDALQEAPDVVDRSTAYWVNVR